MTLENAPKVFGDIERLKAKEKNGGLTKDEQIDLHHAETLLARAQVTNLEAKQKALGKLPTPRDLHPKELDALAKAKAMLARPWPGTAPRPETQTTASTTQSSSGSLPPGDTSTTHGITPPAGTSTGTPTGTANTGGTTVTAGTGSPTSTTSSGGTTTPGSGNGSGTHTTNGVAAPPVGHGNPIPENTSHPEHIDLANRRVENLEKIAAKRKLDPHEQDIYDNARRVRDRNTLAQPADRSSPPPTPSSRTTGDPDHLAMSGDEDALVPVTPDGDDAHLDAAADAPPAAAPAQPANAIGTTVNSPDASANPDAPTASQQPNGQNNPQSKAASNTPPAKLTAKSVKPGQSKGKSPPPGKPPVGKPAPVPPGGGRPVSPGNPRPITPPIFNKTHKNSLPIPKGKGLNGGGMQSHHGLQKQWAIENLAKYGYNPDLAPTVTIETKKGLAHSIISAEQNRRQRDRENQGKPPWSSTLQEELGHIVADMSKAGFKPNIIRSVLEQQYRMLDKLKVPYQRIRY